MSFQRLDEEEDRSSSSSSSGDGGGSVTNNHVDEEQGEGGKGFGGEEEKWTIKKHLSKNRAIYLPIALALGFVLLVIVCVKLAGGGHGSGDGEGYDEYLDNVCTECIRGDPDECGVVPFSLYSFSDGFPVRRNYRPQYNGNPG